MDRELLCGEKAEEDVEVEKSDGLGPFLGRGVPGTIPRVSFFFRGRRLCGVADEEICRNLIVGIEKVNLE